MPMKPERREVTPDEVIQKFLLEDFAEIPDMSKLREGFRRRVELLETLQEDFYCVTFLTLRELERCRAENGLLKIAAMLNEEIHLSGGVITVYRPDDETTFTTDCLHVVNTGTDEEWRYVIEGYCRESRQWVEIDEQRHRVFGMDGEITIPEELKSW